MAEIPEWASALGDEGPKPYETASWTCTAVSVVEDEPEETVDPPWWETIGQTTSSPYETPPWTFSLVETEVDGSCEPSELEDRDDLSCTDSQEWWTEIGGDGPKPYEAAAWTITTYVVKEVDETGTTGIEDWWDSLGGPGPKPYNVAAWTYTRAETFVLEYVTPPEILFQAFDETYFDRTSLDSGYFGQTRSEVYDSGHFLGSTRGVLVKRTISRLMVYDSRASSPGVLGSIQQPLGTLSSDPLASSSDVITDPEEYGIEVSRQASVYDDSPPGVLLGSVSYETYDGVLTITDWEHLNWEDDTPVLMGVKTLLSQIPDGITEVRVLDPPHAFWASLGFASDHKGDPYLHIHL